MSRSLETVSPVVWAEEFAAELCAAWLNDEVLQLPIGADRGYFAFFNGHDEPTEPRELAGWLAAHIITEIDEDEDNA